MSQQNSKVVSDSSVNAKSKCCSSNLSNILIIILALIVGLSAGLYIGNKQTTKSSSTTQSLNQNVEAKKGSYEDGYQSALEFARKKLQEKGMFGFAGKTGQNLLSAVAVKSVSDNRITVEFDASRLDIFSEGTVTKTITVPDSVKIEKRTNKDFQEVQKAYDEYRKQQNEFMKSGKNPEDMKNIPQPPLPYTVEYVKLSELKEGDLLTIIYNSDEKTPEVLNAESVEFLVKPISPDIRKKTDLDSVSPEISGKLDSSVNNEKTGAPTEIVPQPTPTSDTTADTGAKISDTTSQAPTPEVTTPVSTTPVSE